MVEGRQALLDRIAILEEENRQLREALAPSAKFPVAWNLCPRWEKALMCLYRARGGTVSWEQMRVSIYGFNPEYGESVCRNLMTHLRRRVAPFGVKIETAWGVGWALDPASISIIAEAITSPTTA